MVLAQSAMHIDAPAPEDLRRDSDTAVKLIWVTDHALHGRPNLMPALFCGPLPRNGCIERGLSSDFWRFFVTFVLAHDELRGQEL
ncbi:MAG: hypothetical protein LRY61_05355 [Burkholderiaceae bacterium]|nr:hypothetical protein [Burkholderiaceae bacterium]